jgi:hypothetical protein
MNKKTKEFNRIPTKNSIKWAKNSMKIIDVFISIYQRV